MRKKIIEVVKQYTSNGQVPSEDVSLFTDGYLDSFALADLVVGLETEFGVPIPDSELNPKTFESISRIEQYLVARM